MGSSDPPPPPPPPQNPLLLVPGVCGTQLAVRKSGSSGDGDRCWVNVRDGADEVYRKLWGRYEHSSGRVQLLTPDMEVCVPEGGDDSGLFAVSVLDPDVGFAVKAVHYYEPLITFLQTQGYTQGTNLFGAGYDFRQSTRVSALTLLARLQEVSQRCGGARVDVVTHSMGGLVARSLLADRPKEFGALVGRWIAIACPFGGAPGYATDGLITGMQFGGYLGDTFFVKRSTFLQMACQSPSVYEMLPPLDFRFTQPPPQLTLWLKTPIAEGGGGKGGEQEAPLRCTSHAAFTVHAQPPAATRGSLASVPQLPRLSLAPATASASGEPCTGSGGRLVNCGAHQYVFHLNSLPSLLTKLLKDNTVSVEGASIPLPFDPELWKLSQATHKCWQGAKLPSSCTFYNLHGSGLDTPYDVQYGSWWYTVQDLEAVPHTNAAFSYVDGDSTVPTDSAMGHGLDATATVAIKGAHRDLVGMEEVWMQLLAWLQATPDNAAGSRTSSTKSSGKSELAVPTLNRVVVHTQASQPRPSGTPESAAAGCAADSFWNPLVWRGMLA
ncbi:hypothetical protein D9Q98_005744 [Chlorella vulgaris]|uniref:Uncharacterized protein n=1 Tax=Chlorella vulgaris TaxID=3077 RepID=A0A9D4TMN5_CHLVU|nr:hypothetical protein D9Q98_005744 [Chlorella vulgaris]